MPDEGAALRQSRKQNRSFAGSAAASEDLLTGPIRGELLGSDQLAERAIEVARRQRSAPAAKTRRKAPLLARLRNTQRILVDVHARLTEGAARGTDVGPAGEWLLDNFHVVQEHTREVYESLPSGYYRELPELQSGVLAGYPRVYELAITLISHTEGRVDVDNLDLFVGAYESENPLSIGELWAIPAMLRLALIESVRRMALRTVQRLEAIELADEWAFRIEEASAKGGNDLRSALDLFVAAPPQLSAAFISRFLHQLRLTRGSFAPLERLEAWISDRAMSAEDAAARSTQHLALTQVMMAHSITSLRAIGHLNWKAFVERRSVLELILRTDPSGFYPRMTFAARDHYRHVVERIAKRTGLAESEVAQRAIDLAADGKEAEGEASVRAHVGYFLIDDGLPDLERLTSYTPKWRERAHHWVQKHPNVVFGGGIILGVVLALAAVFQLGGVAARDAWILVVLVGFIPAFDIAVSVVNQLVTAMLPPRMLPKLDLFEAGGIPDELRTAVVVPTLFDSVAAVGEVLDHLEVQFLANRGKNLHFAVLSDYTDASCETCPGDAEIIAAAVEGVTALNQQYGEGCADVFYLFHRPRRWNEQQGVWMGWERKRGKLGEFNRFLRGSAEGAFSHVVGDLEAIRGVRFVITLDADTILPPDAAALLIGAIAHPLNRAVYEEQAGRVVRGYGILQPRVGVSLPSAYGSHFAAVHSGHPGVDPYTTAVSDVYQDLYGEGSFTGKGIYEVDTFEQATHGRFPENTLLSHDLIEGSYARAGLVTDINLYDDYPSRYLTYTRRKHRWIRGDWQLLGWLTPHVPGPDGIERNRLPILSRWKILDNLRRSLLEISLLLFLVVGWTILPGSPIRWTMLGVAALAAPWIVSLFLAIVRPPLDKSWRAYYASVGRDAITSVHQVGLGIAFLPHQAFISADAIARTLWRLFVSRRHLLEWQTARGAESSASGQSKTPWAQMYPALAVPAAVLALLALLQVSGEIAGGWQLWGPVGLLITAWAMSPVIARSLDAPAVPHRTILPESGRRDALRYGLLHWRYFDRFVTAETNWLVPDNFQESPAPIVAMRTSPTNIGLQLLATASAYDLGFLSRAEMTRRLELIFGSLEGMARFRGHFFNWYELTELRVLEPAYISTVDSGNLAGHLIALSQACTEAAGTEAGSPRLAAALEMGLTLAAERLHADATPELAANRVAMSAFLLAHQKIASARAAVTQPSQRPLNETLRLVDSLLVHALGDLDGGYLPLSAEESAREWISWTRSRIGEELGESSTLPLPGGALIDEDAPYSDAGADGPSRPESLEERLRRLAQRSHDYAMEMDFAFLFDRERELFSIGYQATSHTLDESYYDLLASESRLASFLAIAKNDVPVDHWFRLGRTLTLSGGGTALISWSGSMFEYLMPALVMQVLPFTVLDQTYRGALKRQIAYGAERGVPWGVSESAYNLRDRHLTYQYRAFGVPDLALKRGLGRDLVIAPYASVLALLIDPERALENLAQLERKGALGPYGFRDALDYTRPDPGKRYAVVCNYMAHHVGMGLVAIANVLVSHVWQQRFHADPLVRSAELLLHERIPRRLVLQPAQETKADEALPNPEVERPAVRVFESVDTPYPEVALLGRLPYTMMISHCGAGYSRYEGLGVTRWRADATRDASGQFCYVKDVTDGRTWSAAHQPVCAPADWYRALLATDRVTFHRRDGHIETVTEIAVVPDDAAEVRCVTVTNHDVVPREVELTSYGEIVLGPPDADRAHPAFANLFVETEWHEWCSAITATRRPRSASEPTLWCVHVVDNGTDRVGTPSCETDRARFLGRGGTTRDPLALETDGPLSGTAGAVLDPIFSIRTRVLLMPGQSAAVAFTTLVATTRERAFELAGRYHDSHAAQRALDLAWTSQQVELRELSLTPTDAAIFQEMAGHLFYPRDQLRASPEEMLLNRGGQPMLWASGVSGDIPIVVATIGSTDGLPTLRQLFAAHHYWRRRGMMVDLVIINSQASSYLQELNDRIMEAIFASSDSGLDQPGGVFVRRRDQIDAEGLLMLRTTARLLIRCDGRSLGRIMEAAAPDEEEGQEETNSGSVPRPPEQRGRVRRPINRRFRSHTRLIPSAAREHEFLSTGRVSDELALPYHEEPAATPELDSDNGYGGLTSTGDYLIRVRGDEMPPAPWVNVVANPHGGFVVSERGGGFTWSENSFFYRLTPWHNDPVSDPVSEVIYLRDEDTGELWSATPAPIGHTAAYTVVHGPGSSTFEHQQNGISTRLTLTMADEAAAKLAVLRVTNLGERTRTLTTTAYVEWTLGVQREQTQHQVRTFFDPETGAILAQNFFEPQFASRVAFLAMNQHIVGHTGDRRDFIGRNGTVEDPAGLRKERLGGTTGPSTDPCAALQCLLTLEPGETREVVVVLGAAEGEEAARRLAARYCTPGVAEKAADASVAEWADRLAVITVTTPEPSFDVMLNRWTLYQALACRMWARSALYQSSGAYGFRDQLQDVLAFVYAEPGVAREHILRAAARQFVEGDVQHWWHPQSGRGVRTRFSDDLAWLPYVVDRYVAVTGDRSILDEYVPFLSMALLEPHQHELYDLPQVADEHGSIYEHCRRALRKACTHGEHGLPLIGIGDWNDGMSRVGVEGRGESVWLAWFLTATLRSFALHTEARGDHEDAADFRHLADGYAAAVEEHGWDGEWYRRAYFDDGSPLGSSTSDECRIDSIAQSWSVISGAGDPERRKVAMQSLEEHLVREDLRLLMLLTPPFDKTPHDPGYIKGYLPGVRENGAQYTHAALWAVLATALQGDGDRAFELYQMINPLTHSNTREGVDTYKVEPYVVAADVYTADGQMGRGGWTWYTGSASWMYRIGLESILGFTKRGDMLSINPSVPASWSEYSIDYRYGSSVYAIRVERPSSFPTAGVVVEIDGVRMEQAEIPLLDDGRTRRVLVRPAEPGERRIAG